jgi:hypothetical protein
LFYFFSLHYGFSLHYSVFSFRSQMSCIVLYYNTLLKYKI